MSDWLRHQSKDFYAEGIRKLVHKWEKCVTLLGDYVEKKIKLLSVLEVLLPQNSTYLLNDPRIFQVLAETYSLKTTLR